MLLCGDGELFLIAEVEDKPSKAARLRGLVFFLIPSWSNVHLLTSAWHGLRLGRSEVESKQTPDQAGGFRPADVATCGDGDGRAHGRIVSLPRPKRRRAARRWRAASQAGRRRSVLVRGGLPKNTRSPKPKTSGIGWGRACAGPVVYPAVFRADLDVRYKSFTTPRNKIISLRASTMANMNGRSTIISNGLGGFISMLLLFWTTIIVTAAASVPASPTSTKAF